MAGIVSKTHDFEDIVFRRDDNSFTNVWENLQSSFTDVRENPGQLSSHAVLIFKQKETVAGGRLIRIRCTLSLKKSTKLFARSRSFSCDGNFLSALTFFQWIRTAHVGCWHFHQLYGHKTASWNRVYVYQHVRAHCSTYISRWIGSLSLSHLRSSFFLLVFSSLMWSEYQGAAILIVTIRDLAGAYLSSSDRESVSTDTSVKLWLISVEFMISWKKRSLSSERSFQYVIVLLSKLVTSYPSWSLSGLKVMHWVSDPWTQILGVLNRFNYFAVTCFKPGINMMVKEHVFCLLCIW